MKTLIALVAALTVTAAINGANAAPIKGYKTEAGAQKHCPNDEVVYGENKSGGVYHLKGTRYYGNLKDGSYVCRKEVTEGGWRPAANGQ